MRMLTYVISKKFAIILLRVITVFVVTATNLSGLGVGTASAQNIGEAKQSKIGSDEQQVIEGEILIKLKRSARPNIPANLNPEFTGIKTLDKINKELGALRFDSVVSSKLPGANTKSELGGWYKVSLPGNGKKLNTKRDATAYKVLERLIDRYKSDDSIEIAQPSFVSHSMAVPNDPFYSSAFSFQGYDDMWGMKKINAANAWDFGQGSNNIIIASIDSGVDANHPDLSANMWTNTDGSHGWNFINDTSNSADDNGHGTFTAGVMGAVGNNAIGVVGVNWTTRIMALKFLDNNGQGSNFNAGRALQWATDKGAKVINNSYGCICIDKLLEDAVDYAHDRGVVVVAAAGNGRNDASGTFVSTIDAIDFTPANADNAIVVGATDAFDQKAGFSNTGPKIDVTAPGVDIISTKGANSCTTNYCINKGTSFAAPHVAGLAALMLANNPSLSPEQIRQLIRSGSVDLGASGRDDNFGYGRINAYNSVYKVASQQLPLAPYFSNLKSRDKILPGQTNETLYGGSPGSNFSSCKIEVGKGRTPTAWTSALGTCFQRASGAGLIGTIDSKTFDGSLYTVRLTAISTSGATYVSQVFDVQIGNIPSVPDPNAPRVDLMYPQSTGHTFRGLVIIKANITGSGITKGELVIDNYKVVASDTTAPFEFPWDTTLERVGNHIVTVRGYDSSGRMSEASLPESVGSPRGPSVVGSTWFSDGTRAKVGPSGSLLRAYATGAFQNLPYRLVSGKNGCKTDLVLINPNAIFANQSGLLPSAQGSINRPPGTYDLCFYDTLERNEGDTITSIVTYTVQ